MIAYLQEATVSYVDGFYELSAITAATALLIFLIGIATKRRSVGNEPEDGRWTIA